MNNIVNIENVVPRNRRWYLDQRFEHRMEMAIRRRKLDGESLSRGDAYQLLKVAERLYALDKKRVGDVVQMSEVDLVLLTDARPQVVAIINDDLMRLGLHLGMKAPGWKASPFPPWVHL